MPHALRHRIGDAAVGIQSVGWAERSEAQRAEKFPFAVGLLSTMLGFAAISPAYFGPTCFDVVSLTLSSSAAY